MFSAAKASEGALEPTTGTGNEKRRTLRKSIDLNFYDFTSVITHLGCWENTRKACKSQAEHPARVITPRVDPTPHMLRITKNILHSACN